MRALILTAFVFVTACGGEYHYVPPPQEERSNPMARYADGSAPELALELASGLEWSRCAAGQIFTPEGECAGTPSQLTQAEAASAAALAGMRLPTRAELVRLVYCDASLYFPFPAALSSTRCPGNDYDPPTILWRAFPDTPYRLSYITATDCTTDAAEPGHAFVSFANGDSAACIAATPEPYGYARFVK